MKFNTTSGNKSKFTSQFSARDRDDPFVVENVLSYVKKKKTKKYDPKAAPTPPPLTEAERHERITFTHVLMHYPPVFASYPIASHVQSVHANKTWAKTDAEKKSLIFDYVSAANSYNLMNLLYKRWAKLRDGMIGAPYGSKKIILGKRQLRMMRSLVLSSLRRSGRTNEFGLKKTDDIKSLTGVCFMGMEIVESTTQSGFAFA